jgi:diketogulonate reductase-like aldo/keto reductase
MTPGDVVERWQAMERLVDEGRCKSIGLSDTSLEKLQEIIKAGRIKPAVVQVEAHPYLPKWELLSFCQQHGIVLLAFAAFRTRDGTQITGKSGDHRYRAAR